MVHFVCAAVAEEAPQLRQVHDETAGYLFPFCPYYLVQVEDLFPVVFFDERFHCLHRVVQPRPAPKERRHKPETVARHLPQRQQQRVFSAASHLIVVSVSSCEAGEAEDPLEDVQMQLLRLEVSFAEAHDFGVATEFRRRARALVDPHCAGLARHVGAHFSVEVKPWGAEVVVKRRLPVVIALEVPPEKTPPRGFAHRCLPLSAFVAVHARKLLTNASNVKGSRCGVKLSSWILVLFRSGADHAAGEAPPSDGGRDGSASWCNVEITIGGLRELHCRKRGKSPPSCWYNIIYSPALRSARDTRPKQVLLHTKATTANRPLAARRRCYTASMGRGRRPIVPLRKLHFERDLLSLALAWLEWRALRRWH
mmetsp:Transcript_5718/g.14260  ORF Transcript_5718/g.14260 Transcript_5718/m.14260 type:complete len:367 (+) Transcript_5718:1177-2277(+)